ncbi:MAG: thiamine diphosphokinase, partial [Chloroflexota bacterium]|nr:thiamine diphosphokinase [Chloroflexota bacterium]
DLDSIDLLLLDRLEAGDTRIERHPIDKEASDTELAVAAAVEAGATSLVLLGAMGGPRLDHELANLLLLADPSLAGRDVRAVRGGTTVRALRPGEQILLSGRIGDLVSLLPVGGPAAGVTTEGLRWPLVAATLEMGRSRGLSNVAIAAPASVQMSGGTLLVIETASSGGIL